MIRKIWTGFVSVNLMILLFAILIVPLILGAWSHRWRINVTRIYSKLWAYGTLWAMGVKLVFTGRENLGQLPAIYAFNHGSNLDFFINACFAPKNCLVFGKRELAKIPFLGWMWLWGGHPMIRRDKKESWQELLDWVAEQLRTGTYCTIVAPEGTRSRHGKLLPFKKGPFHFAIQSGAPMVPVIIKGGVEVFSGGRINPGIVGVEILPPIPTKDWKAETIDEHISAVRSLYLAQIPEAGPDELPRRSVTTTEERSEDSPESGGSE